MTYQDELPLMMSATRWTHVQRVADTAAALARHWQLSESEAHQAGLLHDCAKQLSPALVYAQGLNQPTWSEPLYVTYAPVWHAFVGPYIAKQKWGIKNRSVLSAMQWHSTGRAAMRDLDKLLFVADYIEPGRSFPTREIVENFAYQDLNLGAYAVAFLKLFFLVRDHRAIHPDTYKCREFYIRTLPESRLKQVHDALWPYLVS